MTESDLPEDQTLQPEERLSSLMDGDCERRRRRIGLSALSWRQDATTTRCGRSWYMPTT